MRPDTNEESGAATAPEVAPDVLDDIFDSDFLDGVSCCTVDPEEGECEACQ